MREPSDNNLALINQYVDRIDSANEAEIEEAVFDLLSNEKLVVEVIHQRMMQSVSLKQAELEVVVEARDKQHVAALVTTLSAYAVL